MMLGTTGLDVFPLCLGGNVFGWTADERQSFEVLDAYAGAGGNFIDTADVYSAWIPGNSGGESESILGRWMAARGNRARMIIATKVGKAPGLTGLAPETLRAAVAGSLKRLKTDRINLYYAHADDPETPLVETLRAFDAMIRAGDVRYIAASNYSAPRLAEALAVSKREGLARYVAIQPYYNLVHRQEYEGDLASLCAKEGVSCIPYYALAKGFLTGKYRPGTQVESARAAGARVYLDDRGIGILAALDAIAHARETTVPAVALAWLRAQPTVIAPIASARTPEQLSQLLPMTRLELTNAEVESLRQATRT